MNKLLISVITLIVLTIGSANAEDLVLDAAIGGAVGGAIGGAVGAKLGGRDGAIAGAGIGAAAGAAINTNEHKPHYSAKRHRSHNYAHPAKFCPPGQAKKGRC